MATFEEEIWGSISSKSAKNNNSHKNEVKKYSVVNELGTKLELSNYGASIVSCVLQNGLDVIIGDKTANNFINNAHPHFGLTTGRLAGRSSIDPFMWPDERVTEILGAPTHAQEQFQLEANEKNITHLHGGIQGLGRRVWEAEKFETEEMLGCEFSMYSPHLDQGYPGALNIRVRIGLYTYKDTIHIAYFVESDRPAPINLTNHAYFNLGDTSVSEHSLSIDSEFVCEYLDSAQISGHFQPVEDTVFDFRTLRCLGPAIEELKHITYQPQREGIDHIWRLKKGVNSSATVQDLNRVATLVSASGTLMHTYTTASAIVCYTGNFLPKYTDGDRPYEQHEAICLETQQLPGFLHNAQIPVSMAAPNMPWTSITEYSFEILSSEG